MHNLIEYIPSYSKTTGSLWFHFKVEASNFNADTVNSDHLKSFKCTPKLLRNTVADGVNGI